ncbi:alpha/beta hydrolase [Nonomuraea sediminis]|uniref:alpha/beta hydrolase n=1 Tax=Nonomuraea sediminis TaxID=2835864 RepID=UPI001BDD131A|nr:alpha/beta hydrolase family protein [Nonomuraea sediminis]
MEPRSRGCLIGVIAAVAALGLAVAGLLARRTGPETSPKPVPSKAVVVDEQRPDGRRMELTIRSEALGTTTKVRLLLPDRWESRRDWPVLWLLHGGLDDYATWTAKTDVDRLTRGLGVMVVMPDGGRCGSYSDWWNRGRGGPPRWADYHLRELLPLLESRYRAGQRRAVAGYSMGGQGAMLYAARGYFKAAASFSGAVDILQPGVPQAVMAGTTLGCLGTDWKRIWGDPDEQRAIWRAHNPYDQAAKLRGVRLYVAAGRGDLVEDLANRAARAFTARLRTLHIPVETHFSSGGHNHTTWQAELHRALPTLLAAIGVPPRP